MHIPLFLLAALLEIGGCYLMWMGQKQASTWIWLAGFGAFAGFGLVLAQVSADLPSRASKPVAHSDAINETMQDMKIDNISDMAIVL